MNAAALCVVCALALGAEPPPDAAEHLARLASEDGAVRKAAADNVAAIERGALTRHGRKKLRDHLRRHRRPSAPEPRQAKNPRPKARKAA